LDFSAGRRFAAKEMLWLNREKSTTQPLAPGAVLADLDLVPASSDESSDTLATSPGS